MFQDDHRVNLSIEFLSELDFLKDLGLSGEEDEEWNFSTCEEDTHSSSEELSEDPHDLIVDNLPVPDSSVWKFQSPSNSKGTKSVRYLLGRSDSHSRKQNKDQKLEYEDIESSTSPSNVPFNLKWQRTKSSSVQRHKRMVSLGESRSNLITNPTDNPVLLSPPKHQEESDTRLTAKRTKSHEFIKPIVSSSPTTPDKYVRKKAKQTAKLIGKYSNIRNTILFSTPPTFDELPSDSLVVAKTDSDLCCSYCNTVFSFTIRKVIVIH